MSSARKPYSRSAAPFHAVTMLSRSVVMSASWMASATAASRAAASSRSLRIDGILTGCGLSKTTARGLRIAKLNLASADARHRLLLFLLLLLGRRLFVREELVHEILELRPDHLARQLAELRAERAHGDDRLRHRPVAAGAADVGEEPPHELAGVLRIAEVAHRNDERLVHDAGDDGPLHVFERQEEVGDVGDEVLARERAEEGAEDLVRQGAFLERPQHVVEPLERDFGAFHLPDERRIRERVEVGERFEVHAVGRTVE